jgi:hypothetical protein
MVSAMESKPEVTSWCKSTRTFIYFLLLGIFYSELSLLINSGCALKYILFFFIHIFSWTKQVNSKCQYFSTLVWLLKRALFLTEFSVDIYIYSLTDEFSRSAPWQKSFIRKVLVCDLWYVSNNFIEGFTDRHNTQKKKNNPLHSTKISIDEYNISPT